MVRRRADVEPLKDEYVTLLGTASRVGSPSRDSDWGRVADILEREAAWTAMGAAQIAGLARQYGAFVLRNALALALALGIEDGELGM